MSYTSEAKRANPIGMGAAVLVNGSIILAVALSPLVVQPPKPRDPFTAFDRAHTAARTQQRAEARGEGFTADIRAKADQ